MRVIDSEILTALQSKELRPFLLFSITLNNSLGSYYYTDCDVPILFDSNLYSPHGFEVGSVSHSKNTIVDSADFTIDDINETLKGLFVGNTPEGEGSELVLRLVILDSDYAIVGESSGEESLVLFEGELDDWEIDEGDLSIRVVSAASRWAERTLGKQAGTCRWKVFKGTECAYAGGETWCDRTYTRCTALLNTANFGGFRWLPSLVDKDIWWGKVPSVTAS